VSVPLDLPEVQDAPSADFDAEEKPSGPSVEDLGLVSAVMEIGEDLWRQIAEWGSGTRDLTPAQIKLCYALAKKAATDWESAPTLPQAKQAILVLHTVKKHTGMLDSLE